MINDVVYHYEKIFQYMHVFHNKTILQLSNSYEELKSQTILYKFKLNIFSHIKMLNDSYPRDIFFFPIIKPNIQ